tara:strand:- start:58 stop:765 length:708 start_codon:yes stop_codon:yes gene_type:complete
MPGYKKPKMGHKKPKMAHGKKPKMAHGDKPKMVHGKKPQFNAKLKKAAAEGKLDNNPSFKSAVENAKPKMAHGKKPKMDHGKKPKMAHGKKPKMYDKPKMYNKKPFMMKPGSKEIDSPGIFKANEAAMMFKNNMPKDHREGHPKPDINVDLIKRAEKEFKVRPPKTQGDSIYLTKIMKGMGVKPQEVSDTRLDLYETYGKKGRRGMLSPTEQGKARRNKRPKMYGKKPKMYGKKK